MYIYDSKRKSSKKHLLLSARHDYSRELNWLGLAALLAKLSQNKVFPQNNSEKGLAKSKTGAYAFTWSSKSFNNRRKDTPVPFCPFHGLLLAT